MDEFNEKIDKIKETVGDESTALISNELISLTTEHQASLKDIEEKNAEIAKLKKDKENLIAANSELYLRVGNQMKEEEQQKTEEPERIELNDIIKNGKLL